MNFILSFLFVSFAFAGVNSELNGWWRNTDRSDEKPVQFIKVNGQYYFHGQERFVFPDGQLSHTIDQSLKISSFDEVSFKGTVDFFDSRGCSYKDLAVTGEFQNEDVINVLMTVPRYKVVTITVSRNDPYERPRFCPVPYPGRGTYVCGVQQVVISRRTECQLLETIEIPVQLERIR
jgi:hypothetical protein